MVTIKSQLFWLTLTTCVPKSVQVFAEKEMLIKFGFEIFISSGGQNKCHT